MLTLPAIFAFLISPCQKWAEQFLHRPIMLLVRQSEAIREDLFTHSMYRMTHKENILVGFLDVWLQYSSAIREGNISLCQKELLPSGQEILQHIDFGTIFCFERELWITSLQFLLLQVSCYPMIFIWQYTMLILCSMSLVLNLQ
jgi:hypothetical protein